MPVEISRIDLELGGGWFEGPAWLPDGSLVWSDVTGNRLWTWRPGTEAALLLEPSHHQNGHTVDADGRLLAASHGERAVLRREHDGSWQVLADRWQGRRFNSPNDLVVDSAGAVWFTDPRYGIDIPAEGYGGVVEMSGCHLYRIDPDGSVDQVSPAMPGPNGLAFAPDESVLHVADSEDRVIWTFPVQGTTLGEPWLQWRCPDGAPDGIRVDPSGRIWSSCATGVRILVPGGSGEQAAEVGRIDTPEVAANLDLDPTGRRLAITATSRIVVVDLEFAGR